MSHSTPRLKLNYAPWTHSSCPLGVQLLSYLNSNSEPTPPHLVIFYFHLIRHYGTSNIWKLGNDYSALFKHCTWATKMCFSELVLLFLWMHSRNEPARLEDSYAVHCDRCFQIALQKGYHNITIYFSTSKTWTDIFPASPWGSQHSWSLILQRPKGEHSLLLGSWGTLGARLGLSAAHWCWNHPRTQADLSAHSGGWFSELKSCRWHCLWSSSLGLGIPGSGHSAGGAVTTLEEIYREQEGRSSLSNNFCYICFHE